MALDPMEKDQLLRRMAVRMQTFLEAGNTVACVSAHYNEVPVDCELCQERHANELMVIRNRSGKNLHVALSCLREMLRYQVTDVTDLGKWVEKLKELRVEFDRRKQEAQAKEAQERRSREKKFIVRKREPSVASQKS